MIQNIKLIDREYEKHGRHGWKLVTEKTKAINGEYYDNIITARRFFVNLGGYERHTKTFTRFGHIVTHVISISPDRQSKREFLFDFANAER